ncbi:MAG: hypothetical protein IJM30_00870, partial [Thermoguttaceae bacterium]|nr:hypothetical protein [Thermoguttaceae bacterium]
TSPMRSSSFDRVDLLFTCENPSTNAEDVTFFEYSSCRSTVCLNSADSLSLVDVDKTISCSV